MYCRCFLQQTRILEWRSRVFSRSCDLGGREKNGEEHAKLVPGAPMAIRGCWNNVPSMKMTKYLAMRKWKVVACSIPESNTLSTSSIGRPGGKRSAWVRASHPQETGTRVNQLLRTTQQTSFEFRGRKVKTNEETRTQTQTGSGLAKKDEVGVQSVFSAACFGIGRICCSVVTANHIQRGQRLPHGTRIAASYRALTWREIRGEETGE